MKVLFLTLSRINTIEDSNIYTDILRQFVNNKHEVFIVCPSERRYKKSTSYFENGLVKILSVWTPNIQKTSFFEKTIGTISLEYLYYFAINKYFSSINFELIIYSTPPITLTNLLKRLKLKNNAICYLLLKDIFPQNAVDLGLLRKKSLIYKYFRKKEVYLYNLSDFIGCMSKGNLEYILKNNKDVNPEKIEINPNSIEIGYNKFHNISKSEILSKYNIPANKIIFIYGGNLGLPQGVEYIVNNIRKCLSLNNAFFIIVGDGTEYNKLCKLIFGLSNVLLIKELPKNEYNQLLQISDVGLIFLNPNFTIPNFPSRILSYMENKLPILLATDKFTDIGTIAQDNNFGLSCNILNYELFVDHVQNLLNENLRKEMGINAFRFLKKEFSVEISYNKIISKILEK